MKVGTTGDLFMEADEYKNYQESGEMPARSGNEDSKSIPNDVAEVNLYDLNRELILRMPPMGLEKVRDKEAIIIEYLQKTPGKYWMLLNNELHYYTVFNCVNGDCAALARELTDVVFDLGLIHDISVDNNDAVAFWVNWQDSGDMRVFYMFNYDRGVIEV